MARILIEARWPTLLLRRRDGREEQPRLPTGTACVRLGTVGLETSARTTGTGLRNNLNRLFSIRELKTRVQVRAAMEPGVESEKQGRRALMFSMRDYVSGITNALLEVAHTRCQRFGQAQAHEQNN